MGFAAESPLAHSRASRRKAAVAFIGKLKQ